MFSTFIELCNDSMWQNKYKQFRSKYEIHPTFGLSGVGIQLYGEGRIKLGKNSYMGNYSTILSYVGCVVEVGANCSISHNVRLYTANRNSHDVINQIEPISKSIGNVTIGDGVWICANVVILEGVDIGSYSVVGANSVVTRSIPPNCIVAGNPARIIKSAKDEQVPR